MRITRTMFAAVMEPTPFRIPESEEDILIKYGIVEFDLLKGTVMVPDGRWSFDSLTRAMDVARSWRRQYRIESGLLRFSDEVLMEMDWNMRQAFGA